MIKYKYFLYVSLILLGIVAGIAIRHYYELPIVETINIIDVATLVATVFLAVYIPEVLDRKLQIKRDKRDLIEVRIVQLQALYRKVNLTVQGQDKMTSKDLLVIRNTLDIIDNKLDTVFKLLKYARFESSFSKEILAIKDLTSRHKELLYSEGNNDDSFSYNSEVIKKEEAIYNDIDRLTSLLIFNLSDA